MQENQKIFLILLETQRQKSLTSIQEMLDSIYERFLYILSKNRKIDKDYIKYKIGALIFES